MRIGPHRTTAILAVALGTALWPATPALGGTAGSPGDVPTDDVTVSFTGDLTPLQVDEEGGGELPAFGEIVLDPGCRVVGGRFSAGGLTLDDAVSLDGSTALTLATGEPTLFVNALESADVASVRAEADGTVAGTARVSEGEPGGGSPADSAFYRLRGSWTSSDVLPTCVVPSSAATEPVSPGTGQTGSAVPLQPRITSAVPGPADSGAVTIAFESGDDWAPASMAAESAGAVLGLQYRVDTGTWQPIEAPAGRRGAFTIWELEAGGESRIQLRSVGAGGFSEPSESVSVTPASEAPAEDGLEVVVSDCAPVPLPGIEVGEVEVTGSLDVTVGYTLTTPEGFTADEVTACLASLEWSLAGNDVPDTMRHQPLDAPTGGAGSFEFSAFGLPGGDWTLTVDATSKGDPYAESTGSGTFSVTAGPPPTTPAVDCSESAPGAPSLTAPEAEPDGSHTVGFALSAPIDADAGACTTHVSAFVPSAGIADAPVELDGAGGSFTVPADIEPGVHEVSIATVNAADARFPRAVGSALLAVPEPGSVEQLALSYGLERFAFATGATVQVPPPAVLGADDPAFATLADLPVGMFLDPQTGALFGTAVRPTSGALSVPVQVTDADGETATVELEVEVADPPDDGGSGYPEDLWLPAGELVSVTPVPDPAAAGTFTSDDTAVPTEPFSGTVLWSTPSTDGSTPPQISYTEAGSDVTSEVALRANVVDPEEPVPFTAADDGSCASPGPLLYRSRTLQAGSSVGLLPNNPRTADPLGYELTDGSLPPGVTLDTTSGQLMGSASEAGAYGIAVAAEFSNSTRRAAHFTLEVEESPASLSYPSYMRTVSGEVVQAVPHISGEEIEELLSVVCGVLPSGLRLDDRSGAIVGQLGSGGEGTGSGAQDPAREDPNAPVSIVVGADTESEVVGGSLVLAATEDPGPQVAYPSQVSVESGVPLELSPSTASIPDTTVFRVVNGALPGGLRLRPDSGEVVGTPAEGGETAAVTISAADEDGQLLAAAELAITVEEQAEEASRWWWLWFVVGGLSVAGALAVEATRRLEDRLSPSENRSPTGPEGA